MATAQSSSEALIIDGRAIAARLREQIRGEVAELVAQQGRRPGLATVLIGEDPASAVYVAAKIKACREVGIESFSHMLASDASPGQVFELIDRLAEDDAVSGILCQLPVPPQLDADSVINRIPASKDVDGLTVANAGRLALGMDGLRPCTPLGVMALLASAGVELRGRHAVVIGRSNLFGKPMSQLLLNADATVTVCHRHTSDLPAICRSADILVVATGRAEMVQGSWIKPGTVVIDVGITRTPTGLVGDVCFDEAVRLASAITPVPGGVGPMTIACLLANTLEAARAQR